ncbi:MAG: CDP-glycerol glycerophosphotransferase family protein [Lachnospiraceae bacterium]|nr:CDP-glycerol glycerophosphotransferase family protein [Lachnospiraceae bacterium]MBQ8667156.1 CDP-glycerol glycerophosphotransferase family protein [Lachnospiraceae bacterium]
MNQVILYIDPGTGSMLFTIIIGAVSAGFFVLQKFKLKLKFLLSGGKAVTADEDKIPYVIFSDSKRYWNVFKPVCDEFENRKIDVQYWTMSEDDPAFSEKYNHVKTLFIGEGNKAFSKLNIMNAGVVLATTPGLDVLQWKRSPNVGKYVHILHQPGDTTFYRMFGLDHYDAVLISGEYEERQLREIEKLRGIPRRDTCLTGITYLDTMKARYEALKKDTKDSGKSSGTKTVLLAPTWGETAILSRFGERIISALVNTGYNIIIRPHPQSFESEKDLMNSLMSKFPESDKMHWNRDNDNFEVLSRSDIMITDFSGVMFDYALIFDRPFIYADIEFDKSPYDAAWLEEDMWTLKILPHIGIPLKEEDFDNIREVIDRTVNDESLEKGRERARKETWANPGEAASRTVDYLTNSEIREEVRQPSQAPSYQD